MNNYIKHIVESFDFGSVVKIKGRLNIYRQLQEIKSAIDCRRLLSQQQYDLLTTLTGFYEVANKDELSDVISYFIQQFGDRCSLNWLNVSFVRNMHNLFLGSTFNGDISMWDVSHVVDMFQMFRGSKFNGDISKWDVSNVTDMEGMFHESSFNGDISKWNVKSVTNMNWMFRESMFNGDISKWDVSNVESMHGTFATSKFRGDISGWNVSNVKDMAFMFAWSEFDGNIDNWNPVKVHDFLDIFNSCPLDSNPPKWYNKPVKESFDFNGISKEKHNIDIHPTIDKMLTDKICSFGKDIYVYNNILTSEEAEYIKKQVNSHKYGIFKAKTNGDLCALVYTIIKIAGNTCDLNCIDVSDVQDMSFVFHIYGMNFDGNISKWDVSNVVNMQAMFADTVFCGNIANWNVSNVINMHAMFSNSKFNGNISKWDVSNVRRIEMMFYKSYFSGDINNWNINIDKITYPDKWAVFDKSPLEKNPPKWYKM